MEEEKVAEIIYNKIRNENIKYVEELVYQNPQYLETKEYMSYVLSDYDICVLDILKAIQNNEDLNQIYTYSLNHYLKTDINAFLSYVLMVREIGLKAITDYILHSKSGEDFSWISVVLECFTYEEGLEIKKAFLKVMTNFIDLSSLHNSIIDHFFNTIMASLEENEKKALHF